MFVSIHLSILEAGQYAVIDLSGKNLRIMLLTLKGTGCEPDTISNNYILPSTVMKGTGDQVSISTSPYCHFEQTSRNL